jgi:hypothetical protein
VLLNFGLNSRTYAVQPLLISQSGNDQVTRHAVTFADYNDTYRQDVFVFDHDTAGAQIRAIAGGYTRSTTGTVIPVEVARANLRATTQFENNLYGNVPAHCFDTAGNYQVAYSESAQGNQQTQVNLPVFERVLPVGGTVLGAAVATGAVVRQRYDVFNYIPMSVGRVDMYYVSQDARGYNRGGDISYVSRTAPAGAWGTPVTVAVANAYLGLDRPTAIKNSDSSLRVLFAETVIPEGGSGAALNATAGNVRAYARSETAAITFPFTPRAETAAFAARLQTQPSTTEMKALDALITGLVTTGIWAQGDAFYVPAWLSANVQAMLLNLKGDAYNMAVVGNVTPQLVSGKTGYAMKSDGVAGSLLRSTLIPSAATGLLYTQNSGTLAVYPVSDGQEAGQSIGFDSGSTTGTGFIVPRNTSDQISARVNNVAGTNMTVTPLVKTAVQMILARRTGATASSIYTAGAKTTPTITGGNAASAALPNTALTLLGSTSAPSSRQIGFAMVGSALGIVNSPILEAPVHRFLIDMGAL